MSRRRAGALAPLAGALHQDAPCRDVAPQGILEAVLLVDELELQQGRPADEVDGPFRVLDSGQLDQDPVVALGDDLGLRHAELVHAVADRLEALVEGCLLDVGDPLLAELQGHLLAPLDGLGGLDLQVGELIGEDLLEIGPGFPGRQLNGDAVVGLALHAAEADALLHEPFLEGIGEPFHGPFHGLLRVHLEDQVHAALKIEPQVDAVLQEVVLHRSR